MAPSHASEVEPDQTEAFLHPSGGWRTLLRLAGDVFIRLPSNVSVGEAPATGLEICLEELHEFTDVNLF